MAIYLDLGLAENEVADQSLINGQIGMEDNRNRHAATENTLTAHTHTMRPIIRHDKICELCAIGALLFCRAHSSRWKSLIWRTNTRIKKGHRTQIGTSARIALNGAPATHHASKLSPVESAFRNKKKQKASVERIPA